jgi:hypothetical protein
MAFLVDNVKIGNRIITINNTATMSDYVGALSSRHLSLKLDRADGKKVGLEIPRRQMKMFEVCHETAVPFLAFQLKPAGYEALAKKMGEKVDGWLVVFFNTAKVPNIADIDGMRKTLPEYNRNVLSPDEASELLIEIGCSKQEIIHRISNIIHKTKKTVDIMKSTKESEAKFKLFSRYEFFSRKLAAFLHGSNKVKLLETDEIFPKMFMMEYTATYLVGLECVKCGRRAFAKCDVCLETRYCDEDCQDAIQEQHTEVCARLVEEREKLKVFEEEAVKRMVPYNRREEFAKYEEKLAASWNKYARESLRETERDSARLAAGQVFPPWMVTMANIYSS